MIKLENKEFIDKNPWFFNVGSPNRKLLHKWFYYLDLKRINFYLTDPLDIRNFVVRHTTYTIDEIVHGCKEYWPQNADDLYTILRDRKEDCDGLAVLTASILYSIGNQNIQLALGYYGDPNRAYYSNHAYCLLNDNNDQYLLETTGIYEKRRLERVSEFSKHNTLVSCNAKGEYWIGGIVRRRYEKNCC